MPPDRIMKALAHLVCVCAAASLCACGGGGGNSAYVPTTPDQCTLGLAYADGGNSGIAIRESTDWHPQTNEVARTFSPSCPLQKIERIQVEMCVSHTELDELKAQLLAPDNTRIDLPRSSPSGTCLGTSAPALITVVVNGDLLANAAPIQGSWRVQLRDQRPGYGSGTFIGWSLQLIGVR